MYFFYQWPVNTGKELETNLITNLNTERKKIQ